MPTKTRSPVIRRHRSQENEAPADRGFVPPNRFSASQACACRRRRYWNSPPKIAMQPRRLNVLGSGTELPPPPLPVLLLLVLLLLVLLLLVLLLLVLLLRPTFWE